MANGNLIGSIDNFLTTYGSPMAGLGKVYVAAGKKYGVDPRLPVAISVAESSAGKHLFGPFNAWGWGPGQHFASWEDGISTVTRGLRKGYIDQGRVTPGQIVGKYAPGSDGNDEGHWSSTVGEYMRKMGASPAASAARQIIAAGGVPPSSAVPSTTTTSIAGLDQLNQQITALEAAPSSHAGLRDAAMTNLSRIAMTGKANAFDMLGNTLAGVQADRQANTEQDRYVAALREATKNLKEVKTVTPNGTVSKTDEKIPGSTKPTKIIPGKMLPGLAEAFYDPLGQWDNGRFSSQGIGGHSDHVHVSETDPDAILRAIRMAQGMGLSVRENPYVDPVDPVHVNGSFHYQTFPGLYNGKRLGKAIDVSGPAADMAAFYRAVTGT